MALFTNSTCFSHLNTGQVHCLSSRGGLGGKATTMFKHSCHFSPGGLNPLGETIPAICMFYVYMVPTPTDVCYKYTPHFEKLPAVTHVLFFKLHTKWRHVGAVLLDDYLLLFCFNFRPQIHSQCAIQKLYLVTIRWYWHPFLKIFFLIRFLLFFHFVQLFFDKNDMCHKWFILLQPTSFQFSYFIQKYFFSFFLLLFFFQFILLFIVAFFIFFISFIFYTQMFVS